MTNPGMRVDDWSTSEDTTRRSTSEDTTRTPQTGVPVAVETTDDGGLRSEWAVTSSRLQVGWRVERNHDDALPTLETVVSEATPFEHRAGGATVCGHIAFGHPASGGTVTEHPVRGVTVGWDSDGPGATPTATGREVSDA